ncbi:hypothetical protein HYH03_005591 [Edaphochlamys debaryana]|uniref:Guanylate cyclase domain-containing protein n=1 Tax=Edaphochlamys debaryana TaxID=47281 RepID=A0A836C0Y7_9CHLO|nr:hypothetical protein HYH03_005591 [Edaphochlamys debaryana]|eukprot:KAG2496361.1 hypothetical protein HYH03_005591 [Edaphochlamys debaryana]
MHVRRLLLVVLLAVLTAAPCQANEVCSDTLFQDLSVLVLNVLSFNGVSYRQGELAAILEGPFTKFSACANVTDDESTKKLEWLLLPGWHGGYVMDVFRYMAKLPSSNLKRYNYLFPDLLPPMSEIRTAADVRSLLSMPTSGAYSFTAEDPATLTPFAFLFDDDVHAARNSKMPMFSELAENSCVSKSAPQGPLHPRMFLSMLYRADALTTMAAAGVIKPERAIPSDWDGLLEVLEAHQRLVSLLLMQANTSSSRPSLALPRYGLCVNADHTCGRLGDLFAAIAASIVQFNGTRQGYIFDLTLPPPTLKTLFSRPGWRRAAEVLQSLLQYNAPAAANAAAAVETNGTDGEDGPSCHGIGAQVFNTGECLITFEFETSMRMASLMPAIKGKLGVAPVPGSREVAAGPGGALVPCTADLCAVSYNHDLLYLQPALEGAEAAAAASLAVTPGQISGSDSVPRVGRSPLPVFAAREAVAVARLRQNPGAAKLDLPIINRAPLAVVLDELINVRYSSSANDPITLQDVISFQQSLASGTDDGRYTRQTALDALRETVEFGPNSTRGCESYAQGDWWRVLAPSRGNRSASPSTANASPPNAAGNLSSDLAAVRMPYAAWSGDAALFDATQWSPDTPGQSAGYFRTVWHALHSPNVAPHPRSPMQINLYRHALSYAAMALLAASYNDAPNANATGGTAIGGGVEVSIAELERAWAVMAEVVDPSTMRAVYEDSIAAPQYVAAPGPPAGNSLRAGEKAAIGAAVGAAGVILLVASVMGLVMLRRRRRRQHRDLFGRVMAPKEGPDTTLLITDAQNSTVLWEQLPVEVMDVVLKLHHSTIRSVLARHNGYESATEGDSFILAFATPSAALGFATSCQVLRLPDGRVAVVAYRGLRVRMGLHSGLKDPAQVAFNKVVSSYAYKGDFAELAKLVSDAAPGGLITLSHYAFARLRHTQPGTGSSAADALNDQSTHDGPPSIEVEEPHALFLAVPPSLLCRLALRPQLRVVRTVKLGSLAAPVRRVTVAFMKVVGASSILSDLPGPGARALEAFQQIAGRLLTPGGGYKVEGADGLVLAVFASPVAALAWACSCITALCQHQWEDALLAHELCQVGLDVGTVTHTLTEASGRLSYRGKPMNRAARIAGIGGAGQVLCSGDTWEACGAEEPGLLDRYVGLSLGCMALKGVAQPLEVVQVLPEGQGGQGCG